MHVLVTGYPGAVGTALVSEFLANEIRVTAVARPKDGRAMPKRRGLDVVFADINDPTLDPTTFRADTKYDALIHAAGLVQYHEHLRAETFKTNVFGTRNMLRLGDLLGIERFVYTSTAYVSGNRPHLTEYESGSPDDARNPYEESKIEAENLVRSYGGKPLIIRLSTVIGDSRTGEIGRIGGYSGFVALFYGLRAKLMEYPKNPFWAEVNPHSTMNLVPREWAMSMIRLAALSELDGTLHLTHPHPVGMSWLFEQTFQKGLGLPLTYDRAECERTALHDDERWEKIQSIVSERVAYFGPYVQSDTTYARDRITLVGGYASPPDITEEVIQNQLRYMISSLFPSR